MQMANSYGSKRSSPLCSTLKFHAQFTYNMARGQNFLGQLLKKLQTCYRISELVIENQSSLIIIEHQKKELVSERVSISRAHILKLKGLRFMGGYFLPDIIMGRFAVNDHYDNNSMTQLQRDLFSSHNMTLWHFWIQIGFFHWTFACSSFTNRWEIYLDTSFMFCKVLSRQIGVL